MRNAARLVLLVLLICESSVFAQACIPYDGNQTCAGHKHLLGGSYVYTEDFASAPITVNQGGCCSSYVTVVQGCAQRGYVNISNTASSNLAMHAWLQIGSATAPAGSEFSVRFNIDGVIRGEYVRKLTGVYPQGEDFSAIYPNLTAGSHQARFQAWLVDSPGNSITVSQSFMTIQGVDASLPAGTTANGVVVPVNGAWQQITDTLNFTTLGPTYLMAQGYMQHNSGNPGQHLSWGFSLDAANSPHTIELAVPPTFPSGLNVMDHYMCKVGTCPVPAGPHSITMWAINRDVGSGDAQWRQVEFMALNASATETTLEEDQTTPITVTPAGDGSQVFNGLFTNQAMTNPWTKLMQREFGATHSTIDQNGVGEVYVEFLGTSDSQWHQIDIGIEALYNPTYSNPSEPNDRLKNPIGAANTADFTIVSLMIPPGRYQKFIFMDPLKWDLTLNPNLLRLFVRPTPGSPSANISIGKRYMSFHAVSTPGATACQYD